MAANYPTNFDVLDDPAANLSGPPLHSSMHNQINDVIEAMQAELGLNPSGADATVAAFLAALPSRYVTAPTAWTAVTFVGGWVDYGDGVNQTMQYRKVGDIVELRGLIKTGAIPSTAFVLPVGFRPPKSLSFATVSADAFGRIAISDIGEVAVAQGGALYTAINLQFSTVA